MPYTLLQSIWHKHLSTVFFTYFTNKSFFPKLMPNKCFAISYCYHSKLRRTPKLLKPLTSSQ